MQQVRGQLAEDVLPEVLRHVRFLRESGRLVVLSGTHRGVMVVREGRPVHAACRRPDGSAAVGIEALATMLAWSEGSYAFDEQEGMPATSRNGSLAGAPAQSDGSDSEGTAVTLAGDTEDVLEEAREYLAGSRNGRRMRAEPVAAAARPEPDPRATNSDPRATKTDPSAAAISADAVYRRLAAGDPPNAADPVTVSRGALELWVHLDGVRKLVEVADEVGAEMQRVRQWAAELTTAGLAEKIPEPVYGESFTEGLIEIMNEIMGPMGEIVVEDALLELDLEPDAIRHDRVDAMVGVLASHLHRSDWQLKLRARVARLRAEYRSV